MAKRKANVLPKDPGKPGKRGRKPLFSDAQKRYIVRVTADTVAKCFRLAARSADKVGRK
ncbi:MAG: hypothetical protein N3A38_01255 [Planctomycetota bacterium]|nr:hypothetical protein [Planctomycetota bacterium]